MSPHSAATVPIATAGILTLRGDCLLHPAHDYRGLTVTSVDEERRFNPRLGGGILEADFVAYVESLGLPHPKQMEVAVPANLLALPAVAPLLVSGLTAIVLGSVWTPLAGPPLWLADLLAGYLLWVSALCS